MTSPLPSAGPEREELRRKGQFWTPDWITDAMVAYVLGTGSDHLVDPGVGRGAFLKAATRHGKRVGREIALLGTEIDPGILHEASASGELPSEQLSRVEVADFLAWTPGTRYSAIVANPPYIRHHRLSPDTKRLLGRIALRTIGRRLDGRAGLHVFFLLHALELLQEGGRLAFIMPADTCEGVFAPRLWTWIAGRFRLDAVVTFAPEATPFPQVDTNPLIFFLANLAPRKEFIWARCKTPESVALADWTRSDFRVASDADVAWRTRGTAEGVESGLSRPPRPARGPDDLRLGDCASVVRGIATGANDFFFLTRKKAAALALPDDLLLPAIGRTRDAPGEEVNRETLDELDRRGRPTLLFAPDGRAPNQFPGPVRAYLEQGEIAGFHRRPLISTRRPWYRMEHRRPPPLLFAYLGRRNTRFLRNLAGVVPLSNFSCVYPKSHDPTFLDSLAASLNHPDTLAGLPFVGKSYGSGAVKVEPRGLERLTIPGSVARAVGLRLREHRQPTLPFENPH